jgi:replication factor A1
MIMKVSEIKMGLSNVSVTAKVIDVGDTREVMTRYGRRTVANATIEDDTGEINLSLWQDQIDRVKIGNMVNITGAYVSEFGGKLQLNIPRSGSMEVTG